MWILGLKELKNEYVKVDHQKCYKNRAQRTLTTIAGNQLR